MFDAKFRSARHVPGGYVVVAQISNGSTNFQTQFTYSEVPSKDTVLKDAQDYVDALNTAKEDTSAMESIIGSTLTQIKKGMEK